MKYQITFDGLRTPELPHLLRGVEKHLTWPAMSAMGPAEASSADMPASATGSESAGQSVQSGGTVLVFASGNYYLCPRPIPTADTTKPPREYCTEVVIPDTTHSPRENIVRHTSILIAAAVVIALIAFVVGRATAKAQRG